MLADVLRVKSLILQLGGLRCSVDWLLTSPPEKEGGRGCSITETDLVWVSMAVLHARKGGCPSRPESQCWQCSPDLACHKSLAGQSACSGKERSRRKCPGGTTLSHGKSLTF